MFHKSLLFIFVLLLFALSIPAQSDELISFHTPSNNIHCMGIVSTTGNSIDCEIRKIESVTPVLPKPADCELDWGQRFTVSQSGPAMLVCHGDTVQDPNGMVLDYGKSFSLEGLVCTSSEMGLECKNSEKHGFFLSRARQALF